MINILDTETINRIAAGEVIERPASVVKELIENSVDASSSSVTVEIKGGGIDLIRITDNGCGIEKSEVKKAFLPHATSKLKTASDLFGISTLGFRGEALASIASVSDTEIITKQRSSVLGTRFEPGKNSEPGDVGAPDGTTIIVKDIFKNIPARRKFLKSPATETAYISDIIEKTALVNPEVSFRFISNGKQQFFSNGNGSVKDIIYSVYGWEMSENLVPVNFETEDLSIGGFIAAPLVARANRSEEYYYVNGRYIRNKTVTKAIEDAYAPFLMQHKYPFTVLFIRIDNELVDINVHPAKLEVRFKESAAIYDSVYNAVKKTLDDLAAVPKAINETLYKPFKSAYGDVPKENNVSHDVMEETENDDNETYISLARRTAFCDPPTYSERSVIAGNNEESDDSVKGKGFFTENVILSDKDNAPLIKASQLYLDTKSGETIEETKEDFKKNLSTDYKLIGQVFDTYWLITHGDEAFFIDQHAAHEKILYERLMNEASEELFAGQTLMPGICVSLGGKEADCLETNMETFKTMGFEIEFYGGREYLLTSVPMQNYGIDPKDLFLEILNDMLDRSFEKDKTVSLREKLATRACKAAIKGNSKITFEEARELIEELLSAKDPFNCPHGRPVFISITKDEMEKMFKRTL